MLFYCFSSLRKTITNIVFNTFLTVYTLYSFISISLSLFSQKHSNFLINGTSTRRDFGFCLGSLRYNLELRRGNKGWRCRLGDRSSSLAGTALTDSCVITVCGSLYPKGPSIQESFLSNRSPHHNSSVLSFTSKVLITSPLLPLRAGSCHTHIPVLNSILYGVLSFHF